MQNKTSFAAEQLGASAERALHFIQAAGPRASELVEEWIKAGNAAAVQAAAEQAQGAIRKAARRGLNVLKARGVNVPSAPRVGRLQPSASGGREAWLLPPDNTGAEGVVLAERQESGSYHVSFVFFRHGQNLLRVHNGSFGLARIKQNMQDTLGGAGLQAVNVPWAWAQFRIVERKVWHQTNAVPEPLGMTGVGRFLVDAPSEAPPHPFDGQDWNLTDEEARRLAADSGVLHQWPEFGSWLPGERAIQELLVQIGRRFGPNPPAAQEEIDPIIIEQVAAATDRYFTPERRAVLADRLRDSGLSVLARLGEDAARRVAAVVRVIQDAGLITNPPSNVRFLTAYFDKALSVLMAQGGGQLRVPVPVAAPAEGTSDSAVQGSAAEGAGNEAGPADPLETRGAPAEAAAPGA